ncbi:hypothetical protein [Saccharopolyspora griseoalba]|uniref:Uncharacterized protein n=1 Tax=Saccharopolyspora griseoalba TaxID=1431848 RepID=A0ABW2LV09_9PSEU
MSEQSWGHVIGDAEALAAERASSATEPEMCWSAPPGVLIASGECARWLVDDGRARWVGDCVLLEPPPKLQGGEPRLAAAEAYVRTLAARLADEGVTVRLVGLAEPERRTPGQSWDEVVRNGMRAFRPPENGWFGAPVENDNAPPPQHSVVEVFQASQQC